MKEREWQRKGRRKEEERKGGNCLLICGKRMGDCGNQFLVFCS
jgi:hypothetical protein